MYVRKLKRKCSVRGCKCTESFSISRSREAGNSVIICKGCLESALESINGLGQGEKDNVKKNSTNAIPPLFFNAEAIGLNHGAEESQHNATDVPDQAEVEAVDIASDTEPVDGIPDGGINCPKCGRVFESARGLNVHLKSCKGMNDKE